MLLKTPLTSQGKHTGLLRASCGFWYQDVGGRIFWVLCVARWSLHELDLFQHVPRVLNRISIWWIWRHLEFFLLCSLSDSCGGVLCPARSPKASICQPSSSCKRAMLLITVSRWLAKLVVELWLSQFPLASDSWHFCKFCNCNPGCHAVSCSCHRSSAVLVT